MPFPPILLIPLAIGAFTLLKKNGESKSAVLPGGWETARENGFYFLNFPDFLFYPARLTDGRSEWQGIGVDLPSFFQEEGGFIRVDFDSYAQAEIVQALPPAANLKPEAKWTRGIFRHDRTDLAFNEVSFSVIWPSVATLLYEWLLKVWNVSYYHEYYASMNDPIVNSGDCISDDPPFCYKIYGSGTEGYDPPYMVELLGPGGSLFSKVTDQSSDPDRTIVIGQARFTSVPIAIAWAMRTLKICNKTVYTKGVDERIPFLDSALKIQSRMLRAEADESARSRWPVGWAEV